MADLRPPRRPGDFLRRRYRVLEVFDPQSWPRRYLVRDFYCPGLLFHLHQYPLPPGTDKEKLQELESDLRAERRRISWLRHSRIDLPHDLYLEGGCVWSVRPVLEGETLEERVRRRPATAYQAILWARELCELYAFLHQSHLHPLVLGELALGNVVLRPDGQVCLAGFELDENFRVRFRTRGERPWSSPEEELSPVSDVCCLGLLIQRLVPARAMPARLARLVGRCAQPDPQKRPPNMLFLRSRLGSLARDLEPAALPEPPWWSRYLTLSWEVTPPFRSRLARTLALVALLTGLLWGSWRVASEARSHGGALKMTPVASLSGLPEGSPVWVEGVALGQGALLEAPLSELQCLAYQASVRRLVRQQIFDRRGYDYQIQEMPQIVLEVARASPFWLEGDGGQVAVDLKQVSFWGVPRRFSSIPANQVPSILRRALLPLGQERPERELGRLRVGQQVLSTEGSEWKVLPGRRVCLSAVVGRRGGEVVLLSPAEGASVLFAGSRAEFMLAVLGELLPGLLVAALCGLLAGGWAWRSLARTLRRRRLARRAHQARAQEPTSGTPAAAEGGA